MPGSDWFWRFHRDYSAWVRDPKVFLDRGRLLPGEEPLLKQRRYLRKDAAEQLWRSLQTQGWKPLKTPAWGRGVRLPNLEKVLLQVCVLPIQSSASSEQEYLEGR